MSFTFIPTTLQGVTIVQPIVHTDDRGHFLETYQLQCFRANGFDLAFVQDNQSCSVSRTLRGLHLQVRHPQGKLIRVIEGAVWDVAVDVRRSSSNFKKWISIELSAANHQQLYIPPGFAHGFYVLNGERAQVSYKTTDFYYPEDELGIAWNDPQLAISWPDAHPVLSDRDRSLPTLEHVMSRLPQ